MTFRSILVITCLRNGVRMKTCFKCNAEKPLSEFYSHKRMAAKVLGKCKECTKVDVKARYYSSRKSVRVYEAQRAKSPERKAKVLQYQQRRRARDPMKDRARYTFRNAIRDGIVVPPIACSRCRATGVQIQGHHTDYSKPLDVEWLCFLCHREHGHGQRMTGLVN